MFHEPPKGYSILTTYGISMELTFHGAGRRLRKMISKKLFSGGNNGKGKRLSSIGLDFESAARQGGVCQEGPGPAALATHVCSLRGWWPCDLGESTGLGVTTVPLAPLQASVPHLLHEHTKEVDSTPGPGSVVSLGTHRLGRHPNTRPHPHRHRGVGFSSVKQAHQTTTNRG